MSNLDREGLNLKLIESLQQCGLGIVHISPLSDLPFKLRIFNQNISETLKIYVWNIQHGGKTRSKDEYRIQVQVDRFQLETGYKILVLGWWDEATVFAGFDVRKHRGRLGNPSSIQTKKSALRKAASNGMSAHERGNKEVVVAFRPEFFLEYIKNLEQLHDFGESALELRLLDKVMKESTMEDFALGKDTLDKISEPRRSTVVTITRKIRKASFRPRVLAAYSHQCAFCDVQLDLVEAAHIVPVEHEVSTDETSNGLALCALHHRAYDTGLVTTSELYRTLVNEERIKYLQSAGHAGGLIAFRKNIRQKMRLPIALRQRPDADYIKEANRLRGWN